MPSATLLDIFQNDLILRHTSPYIGTASLFSLKAVCRMLNKIIRSEPQVFRYLDLSSVRSINKPKWPPNSATNLTTEEYYGKPVHDALEALRVYSYLEHVSTLVLDWVYLPCKILFSILNDGRNRVRILSLQAVQLLSQDELASVVRYVIRTGRPECTPSLKALYYFRGKGAEAPIERMFRDTTMIGEHEGITTRSGASLGGARLSALQSSINDDPYEHSPYIAPGPCLSHAQDKLSDDWASLVRACEGLIAFDMVLCPHDPARLVQPDPRPRFATIRLPPCSQCTSCPEGAAFPGISSEHRLPLLSPPPLHTSSVKAAQRYDTGNNAYPPFIARCRLCLKDRWCERCNAWWCEDCYTIPAKRESDPRETSLSPLVDSSIKVHNGLCVRQCLMDDLLNGVGEGGMWG